MKKNLLLFGGAAILALTAAACSGDKDTPLPEVPQPGEEYTRIDLPSFGTKVVSEVNQFTMKYFANELNTANPEKYNLFVSPYNSYIHLSLLANGDASGELARTLYSTGEGNGELNEFNRTILEALPVVDKTVVCNFATALWYNKNLQINESFAKNLTDYYAAEMSKAEMSSQATMDAINNWGARVTHGLIPSLLSRPLSEMTNMYLANAVYFKGDWTVKFDPQDTRPAEFTNIDGSNGKVSLMNLYEYIPYYKGAGAQVIELPYGHGNFVMRVYLPDEGTDFKTFVSSLNAEEYSYVPFSEHPVNLYVPKFDTMSYTSPDRTLKDMGIMNPSLQFGNIFDGTLLNWPGMMQAARIIVNEEGTEAAALNTSFDSAEPGSEAAEPVTVRLDRPFVYFITEKSTGIILFTGAVTHF